MGRDGGDDGGKSGQGAVVRAMALHATAAGLFFFTFQRFAMKAPLETSLAWAAFFAAAAAMLAWKQTAR